MLSLYYSSVYICVVVLTTKWYIYTAIGCDTSISYHVAVHPFPTPKCRSSVLEHCVSIRLLVLRPPPLSNNLGGGGENTKLQLSKPSQQSLLACSGTMLEALDLLFRRRSRIAMGVKGDGNDLAPRGGDMCGQ